jgi:hypothetical protein
LLVIDSAYTIYRVNKRLAIDPLIDKLTTLRITLNTGDNWRIVRLLGGRRCWLPLLPLIVTKATMTAWATESSLHATLQTEQVRQISLEKSKLLVSLRLGQLACAHGLLQLGVLFDNNSRTHRGEIDILFGGDIRDTFARLQSSQQVTFADAQGGCNCCQ